MFLPKSLRRVLKVCLPSGGDEYIATEDVIRDLKNQGIIVTDKCRITGDDLCLFNSDKKLASVLHALEVGDYSYVHVYGSAFNCFVKVGDFSAVSYAATDYTTFDMGQLFAISGKQCCKISIEIEGKSQDPGYDWARGFALKGDSFKISLVYRYVRHYYNYNKSAWYFSLYGDARTGPLQLTYNGELLCEIPSGVYFSFSGCSLGEVKKSIWRWKRDRKRVEANGREARSICA